MKARKGRRREKREMKDHDIKRVKDSQHTNISDPRLPPGAGRPRNGSSSFSTPTCLLFQIISCYF